MNRLRQSTMRCPLCPPVYVATFKSFNNAVVIHSCRTGCPDIIRAEKVPHRIVETGYFDRFIKVRVCNSSHSELYESRAVKRSAVQSAITVKRVIVENAFMIFVHEIIGSKISFSAVNIVRLCNRGYLTRPDVRSKDATNRRSSCSPITKSSGAEMRFKRSGN